MYAAAAHRPLAADSDVGEQVWRGRGVRGRRGRRGHSWAGWLPTMRQLASAVARVDRVRAAGAVDGGGAAVPGEKLPHVACRRRAPYQHRRVRQSGAGRETARDSKRQTAVGCGDEADAASGLVTERCTVLHTLGVVQLAVGEVVACAVDVAVVPERVAGRGCDRARWRVARCVWACRTHQLPA